MKIAVLGAGAWGTAIGISLAARHAVRLWARDAQHAARMATDRGNHRYLPDRAFPSTLEVTGRFEQAIESCDLILIATPSGGLGETLRRLVQVHALKPLVLLCKGFEAQTGQLLHQVVARECGETVQWGLMSGPSFADEIARGLPAALTLASNDAGFASATARDLHHPVLRIYSSEDVTGVEIAGAVKNVMAIAAGVCDGLGLGYNARAALMARGLAEITRLGVRLGGRLETFMGLAGAGDLILTCTGDLSRNRKVGIRLAQGERLDDILAQLGHVAEGVNTARAAYRLARELTVEMPITRAVCRLLDDELTPQAAVRELLDRDPRSETG